MPLVYIPDETKDLMDEHRVKIKKRYITYNLFLDAAVRSKLRRMGIKTPEDKILSHLRKLLKNKKRYEEKRRVRQLLEIYERQDKEIVNKLDELDF